MTVRATILTLVTAAALVAVAAWGERVVTRSAKPDRVTVVYWEKWTGAEGEAMQKVVDDFNASQDKIFVKYLSISGVDQKTMLATAGGNPPDVAGIWQDQAFTFAELGALTDLEDMATAADLTRDYYIPAYYDALSKDGHLWGLPSTPASIGLYVRPDLVPADVATPETFPKTLEELDALSDRITKKKDGRIELAGFLPSNPGWWNYAWPILFGGENLTDHGPTVDTPEARRAFNWVAGYAKRYGSQAVQSFQSGFGNFASPQDPFMNGKVATEMNGVWKANYIKVYKPGTPFFAVPFPYPADRPDLAGHAVLSQDILCIPRGAKHKAEAFEFIKYVQRQDVMEGLCKSHGKNSPLEKVSEEFFRTHPNKAIRLFDSLARSPKAFSPPLSGFAPQVGTELNNAFQEVNTGSKTPEQALKDAQKRLDTLYKTYVEQVKPK
ncbi:MAG: ABC transporter substrate-binding protein [Armatimonadetes bacterium]|nr:ABC transporter substrate-binding protein [Armatimonadota bacterium]